MTELTNAGIYEYWYEEKLRFADIDMLGHVNNVAMAALIETGRLAFGNEYLGFRRDAGVLAVIARIEIDYRRELHFPAAVRIGSRLLAVGNSSLKIANGVFAGENCAATSITTLVLIDTASRRPVPIPAASRAALERLLPTA